MKLLLAEDSTRYSVDALKISMIESAIKKKISLLAVLLNVYVIYPTVLIFAG